MGVLGGLSAAIESGAVEVVDLTIPLGSDTQVNGLPPTGSVVIAAPLKIVNGSGSPLRVLALCVRSDRSP